MSERPTVHEVAAAAGVSIATVSRVLNGKGGSPDSVERVRAAASSLGYVPAASGRALKHGRSMQFAFVVDDLENPVYSVMMRGVETGLAGEARLLVSSSGHEPADLLEVVESLHHGYADGLIISPIVRTPELIDALVQSSVPVVVIGDLPDGVPLDLVRTDSATGIGMALEHVLSRGRRRVVFVNGPEDTAPGSRRRAGYMSAAARLAVDLADVVVDDFSIEAGEQAWEELVFRGLDDCDAVVAANDVLALGVLRSALSSGRSVPGDLVVTGMDDIPFARAMAPSLTTVSLGARERGRMAAEMLLERLHNPSRESRRVTVEPELIVRDSTG